MIRQIALDTETTGLDASKGHRLIEIGCIEIIDRTITGNTWHYYINPERTIDQGAINVHGITNEMLQDKPLFKDIADAFIDFVKDSELIIHNATFDLSFLDNELSIYKPGIGKVNTFCQIIDTLLMARQKHPGQKNNLDALCKRYAIDNSARNLHGALLDAQLLALLYLAMTGGQGSLFSEHTTTTARTVEKQVTAEKHYNIDIAKLIVHKATNDELALHRAKLAEMKKPLWEEI